MFFGNIIAICLCRCFDYFFCLKVLMINTVIYPFNYTFTPLPRSRGEVFVHPVSITWSKLTLTILLIIRKGTFSAYLSGNPNIMLNELSVDSLPRLQQRREFLQTKGK